MLASEKDPGHMTRLALATDFSKLLKPRTGVIRRLIAMLSKYHYERTLPDKGVFSSEPFAEFIDELII